jgi:hypothetical protein
VLGTSNELVIDAHFRVGLMWKELAESVPQQDDIKLKSESHLATTFSMRKAFDFSSKNQNHSSILIEGKTNEMVENGTSWLALMDSTMVYCLEAANNATAGEYERSEELFTLCLSLRQKKFGKNEKKRENSQNRDRGTSIVYRATCQVVYQFAEMQAEMGFLAGDLSKVKQAREKFENCLEIISNEKKNIDNSEGGEKRKLQQQQEAMVLFRLSKFYKEKSEVFGEINDLIIAKSFAEKAIKIYEAIFGNDHETTKAVMAFCADIVHKVKLDNISFENLKDFQSAHDLRRFSGDSFSFSVDNENINALQSNISIQSIYYNVLKQHRYSYLKVKINQFLAVDLNYIILFYFI